ncbi:hypothetical protein PR003_g21278 [Phytophthora rubi]|uniref:Uncharacterized protein n=1 Tax=Phytophthora rubi TaxID=129364 RepID=A0A6A4DHC6_9STRA|nr:hypothetical protein PR001_g23619 [Phytophthora rubi]KAE9306278.1 hypothetical protein PR003_g21278 [Phytophthora rubi]
MALTLSLLGAIFTLSLYAVALVGWKADATMCGSWSCSLMLLIHMCDTAFSFAQTFIPCPVVYSWSLQAQRKNPQETNRRRS